MKAKDPATDFNDIDDMLREMRDNFTCTPEYIIINSDELRNLYAKHGITYTNEEWAQFLESCEVEYD